MNDERLGREIGDFYRETDVAPPDSEESAREVASRLPQVEQVKRRRWRPVWRIRAGGQSDSHTHATVDHTPSGIRRNQSMLSPAKAISTGALVFAIGGALLIAQPFDQEAIAPGASSDDQPAPPVEFRATWAHGGELEPGKVVVEDSVVYGTGRINRAVAISEATDPRLRGTLSIATNSVNFNALGGPAIWHRAFRIENEGGAWQQVPAPSITFSDGEEPAATVGVLVGEGGYEGLIAVYENRLTRGLPTSTWDLRGYILEHELPPPPVPFVEE